MISVFNLSYLFYLTNPFYQDHINFNVGKQAYLIGDLNTSCKALAETLNSSSRQSAERQLIFVKEYLSTLTVSRLCCTFFQFHFTLEYLDTNLLTIHYQVHFVKIFTANN